MHRKRTSTALVQPVLRLYWCSTEDAAEDWFVIAPTMEDARAFFAEATSTSLEVSARLIFVLRTLREMVIGWPTEKVFAAAGVEMLRFKPPRVAKHGDDLFVEGAIHFLQEVREDNIAEAAGQGRPNETRPLNFPRA